MARSKIERLWIGGGSLVALLVAAIAWFVVVSPELSNASSLRSQTDSARAENSVLQAKLSKLQQDQANMASLTTSLDQVQAALPADSGLAAFTQQLGAQAAASHVTITSITASSPAPVGAGGAAPSSGTSASGATAHGTQAQPTGGLYSIGITLSITGTSGNDVAFLRAVQTAGQRAVLVTSVQVSGAGAATTLSAQLQVFSSPASTQTAAAPQRQSGGSTG